MQTPKKIAIVGSGLVGTLLGIYLKRRGHTVHIFDRSPDIRKINFSGRSINLVLSDRGIKTLKNVGLEDEILGIGIPVEKRAIHTGTDRVTNQFYGLDGEVIYSISRGLLNKKMVDLAEQAGVEFFFESKIWDVTLTDATLHMGEEERGEWTELKYDLVFGADGAFSRIRHRMQRQSMFNYSQEFLNIGYKELNIPANSDGSHKLDEKSLHIWPRGNFMLMALANLDGSFTCTLFMPYEKFDSVKTDEEIRSFFNSEFPDAMAMMPTLVEDYKRNPIGNLVTVKCYPWVKEDKLALAGDAAHAIVPFYGQGMNCSFEDIVVLDNMIEKYGSDWNTIFDEYQKERKPNADAIADLAVQNYYEMADKVGDKHFLHKKHIEHELTELYPDKFKSQYELTTFSLSGYKYAWDQGQKNDVLLEKIITDGAEEKIKDASYMEQLWHLIA